MTRSVKIRARCWQARFQTLIGVNCSAALAKDCSRMLMRSSATRASRNSACSPVSVGEITGVLPQIVWQELTHKLMLAEAMAKGIVSGSNPAARLAAKPEAVRKLSLCGAKVLALFELGTRFEPCTLQDLTRAAFKLQEKYGLLTNDAVILAVALRLKADVLVSADRAFRTVTELAVARPTDVGFQG